MADTFSDGTPLVWGLRYPVVACSGDLENRVPTDTNAETPISSHGVAEQICTIVLSVQPLYSRVGITLPPVCPQGLLPCLQAEKPHLISSLSVSFYQLDLRLVGGSGHKFQAVAISFPVCPHPTRMVGTHVQSFSSLASPPLLEPAPDTRQYQGLRKVLASDPTIIPAG